MSRLAEPTASPPNRSWAGGALVDCPGCGSSRTAQRWDAAALSPGKTIEWCERCGLGWQQPLPTPAEIRYYYEHFPVYNLHGEGEKESLFALRLRQLGRLYPSKGRLLDIGAGLGHFLKLARQAGWDVMGVEPQAAAAEHCRDRLGIPVHVGWIGDLDLEPRSFDVVTLWDVLEHVHEPLAFLERCASLVKPGGLLALAIPNASGLPARLFKGQWRYVIPTHLSYFTMPYARARLSELGFRIRETRQTLKLQSVVSGLARALHVGADVEKLVRLGRSESASSAGDGRHARDGSAGGLRGLRQAALGALRRAVLRFNRTALPLPIGDLVDIYAVRLRS